MINSRNVYPLRESKRLSPSEETNRTNHGSSVSFSAPTSHIFVMTSITISPPVGFTVQQTGSNALLALDVVTHRIYTSSVCPITNYATDLERSN